MLKFDFAPYVSKSDDERPEVQVVIGNPSVKT